MIDIKSLGPKAAAEYMHMTGQGQESNPYPKGSDDHKSFMLHMGKLQQREFKRECQEMHYVR